ncbi:MAG TPA: phosphotransferase [Microlunatus sp.]|nr:phosphotransferase [Microlunatus sp.]
MPDSSGRFGPLRSLPPAAVVDAVGGDARAWRADRLGSDGPYPNGGMWRVHQPGVAGASAVVKRTGPAHLGGDPVWAGSIDAADPQWWGREAEFYSSELADAGWATDCRPARCLAVDDHDDVRDLWLEDVDDIPLPRELYACTVRALAGWQQHHRGYDQPWLAHGWIAAHLRRRDLDNARTIGDRRWSRLFEAGIPRSVLDAARRRVTDPTVVERLLGELPQLLTHHDFHPMNLGRVGDQIVIIDWATVGPGPVGHDVGFTLVDQGDVLGDALPEEWQRLVIIYAEALADAGAGIATAAVERSAAISNVLRHGWLIDYVLDLSEKVPTDTLATVRPLLAHLAELQGRYLAER